MRGNQATTNITNKYFGIVFSICFLLIALSCLCFSSLNISSTIRDLKLKGMSKFKQVWPWQTYFCLMFSACPKFYEDLFKKYQLYWIKMKGVYKKN